MLCSRKTRGNGAKTNDEKGLLAEELHPQPKRYLQHEHLQGVTSTLGQPKGSTPSREADIRKVKDHMI